MPEGEQQATSSQSQADWKFHSEESKTATFQTANISQIESVEWSASEFVEHKKTSGWYGMLVFGGLVIAAVVYLLTQDVVSTAVVIIVAVVFGIFAARRPRVLNYRVDSSGITIGEKLHSFANFKSFSVVQEGSIRSIWFMPLKRFMPILTIYFEPKDENKIVDVLSKFLPVEVHKLDAVDRLMHRLRF